MPMTFHSSFGLHSDDDRELATWEQLLHAPRMDACSLRGVDHVPEEYQIYTWPSQDFRTVGSRSKTRSPGRGARINPSGRCSLIVYWTFSGYKRP